MNALEVFRSVNFDWAMRLSDVWGPAAPDAPELHANLRAEFARKLEQMRKGSAAGSPLGWVVVGGGGTGKTHLLGSFRREATLRKCGFVLVDMTDVRNFWETVLQGYLDSLQQSFDGDDYQYEWMLKNTIEQLGPNKPVAQVLAILAERPSRNLLADIDKVLRALGKVFPRETLKHQNVVRALICLNSGDYATSSLGMTWLQGQTLDEADRKAFGFTLSGEKLIKIVEALSWFMSLSGPMVLAFDQLDPIVAQLHHRKQGDKSSEERATSESIIVEIGGGLGALRDMTRNTLTIISCVESTWEILGGAVLKTFIDRFEPPWRLANVGDEAIARSLVLGRLDVAYKEAGFAPPYPTYPFRPEAFRDVAHDSPREILKRCELHRQHCLRAGVIQELTSFRGVGTDEKTVVQSGDGLAALDRAFDEQFARADPAALLEEKHEDERLAPRLRSALECLLHETKLPDNVLPFVDTVFTGGATTRPLHARLRLIFTDENEREEHFCVRALQLTNARAYQARLKAAMTQAGIDQALRFRRLSIVRAKPIPGGAETERLTKQFEKAGGVFLHPTEHEIRTIHAVHELKAKGDPNFEAWLKDRRPLSQLKLIREIAPIATVPPKPAPDAIPTNGAPPARPPARLPIGRRSVSNKPGEPIEMPLSLLEKHTLVLAGAGSGKTVLLKRLIEEALLLGIPSIVIDCANDLATLGEAWSPSPEAWDDDDRRKAEQYHRERDVIVWTPGKEAGNPLSFEPVPDLAPFVHDKDELEAAISMVVESLASIVARGHTQASSQKQAILSKALRHLAQHGGGRITELIELLEDLPPDAGLGVANESKLAKAVADALKAEMEKNPLLRSQGTALDPAVLLGDDTPSARVRISVINFVGLPGLDAQRYFLNQLAMTLFSWIKKNPSPPGRPLRGLLVIDEAKDFVPSQKESICKNSLMRLTAQARKYHLGLVFATQNPKDIDNTIVANCSTHFYGKVNSPAAIETVREMLKAKGASGDDVPRLARGQFYVHNADAEITVPVKVLVPLCLSRHPSSPLDETSIQEKAAESRKRLRIE